MPATNLGTQLGVRLRELREALGWSQAQLAEAVGVTPNYVGVVERGEKLPTLETVEAFGRALGTPVSLLFAEDTPDTWADEAAALTRSVPAAQRNLVMGILRAVVVELRREGRAEGYPSARSPSTHALAEKKRKRQ